MAALSGPLKVTSPASRLLRSLPGPSPQPRQHKQHLLLRRGWRLTLRPTSLHARPRQPCRVATTTRLLLLLSRTTTPPLKRSRQPELQTQAKARRTDKQLSSSGPSTRAAAGDQNARAAHSGTQDGPAPQLSPPPPHPLPPFVHPAAARARTNLRTLKRPRKPFSSTMNRICRGEACGAIGNAVVRAPFPSSLPCPCAIPKDHPEPAES